mgnify:CR=1 FL=1
MSFEDLMRLMIACAVVVAAVFVGSFVFTYGKLLAIQLFARMAGRDNKENR